jgi:hypothetical protein
MEPPLALLPRTGLDTIEICGFPKFPHSTGYSLYKRRVAVVKSEYCAHIYARPGSSADLRSLTLSTLKTFGPLSLFSRHQTDFFIIRLPKAPECQIWREFYAGDPDQAASAKIHEDFRNYRPAGELASSPSQGELAVDPEAIDWGSYDAVIIQDLCLPERLLRRFPDVFWSYCIGETGSPSFKQSFRKPASGYHLYLNGSSRRWRVRPGLRSHVIEFPYILQDSRTHSLLGAKPWGERSGILLEVNTARAIPSEIRTRLQKIAPVAENIGTPSVRLDLLHSCRYFVQMISKRLWGNSLNEAVAAGCLGLANPDSMPNNRSLLMPGLTPRDWDSMLSLLQTLETDLERAELEYRQQQALSDWLLCDRPISDWETRLEKFRCGEIL